MIQERLSKWRIARDETLGLWQKVREMVDEPDELELLTEINAICALCDAANAEESKTLTRCERCLAFQQFGGCQQINLEMSERIVEKDWDALRLLVDDFIDHLSNLELPKERETSEANWLRALPRGSRTETNSRGESGKPASPR